MDTIADGVWGLGCGVWDQVKYRTNIKHSTKTSNNNIDVVKRAYTHTHTNAYQLLLPTTNHTIDTRMCFFSYPTFNMWWRCQCLIQQFYIPCWLYCCVYECVRVLESIKWMIHWKQFTFNISYDRAKKVQKWNWTLFLIARIWNVHSSIIAKDQWIHVY